MDVDRMLATLNRHGVDYLLIGGMNFLLRHQPVVALAADRWRDGRRLGRVAAYP